MSNSLPRKPVHLIEQNQELLKSQAGWAGQREGSDWKGNEENTSETYGMQSSYRTPMGRESGNVLFRRYPNGSLDIEYAKHAIVDALHRVKDSGGCDQLNSLEKTALSVLFPMSFNFVSPDMVSNVASVQLRLSEMEIIQIKSAVASHLLEEENYNAGHGGSSIPGRHMTRA